MGGGFNLVIPDGVGRAAEKLADTLSHVVDIAVGPERIRGRAQAQADSAVILAKGRAEVLEVEAQSISAVRFPVLISKNAGRAEGWICRHHGDI